MRKMINQKRRRYEIYLRSKMKGTRRIEHKTNEAVLDEVNKRRTMTNAITKIKRKKWTFPRHNRNSS